MNISPDWTPAERLEVIEKIASKMNEKARLNGGISQNSAVNRSDIIGVLCLRPADQLEQIREHIFSTFCK